MKVSWSYQRQDPKKVYDKCDYLGSRQKAYSSWFLKYCSLIGTNLRCISGQMGGTVEQPLQPRKVNPTNIRP